MHPVVSDFSSEDFYVSAGILGTCVLLRMFIKNCEMINQSGDIGICCI